MFQKQYVVNLPPGSSFICNRTRRDLKFIRCWFKAWGHLYVPLLDVGLNFIFDVGTAFSMIGKSINCGGSDEK